MSKESSWPRRKCYLRKKRQSFLFISNRIQQFQLLFIYFLTVSISQHFRINKSVATYFLLCKANVIVHISNRKRNIDENAPNPVREVYFCANCPQPRLEGSIIHGLIAKFISRDFDVVSGDLVYCVPNSADSKKPVNRYQFMDRVVLVDRGKTVTLQEKVRKITANENVDGAIAILIADDGQCLADFSFCGTRVSYIYFY